MSDLDVQLKYKNKNGGYDNLYPKTKGDIVQMNDGRNVEQILDEVTDLYNQVIEDGTNSDVNSAPEIIAARNGEANLKTRLDKDKLSLTAQLQQTEQNLNAQLAHVANKIKNKIRIAKVYPTIVCYGDSNTRYYESSTIGTISYAYSSFLERLFVKVPELFGSNIINAGYGGQTIEYGLSEYATNVTANNPDIVIVGFGTNNIKVEANAMEDYISKMETMIANLRSDGIEPIVLGIPYFDESYAPGMQARIPVWNEALKQLCIEYNVDFIDAYNLFPESEKNLWFNETANKRHYSFLAQKMLAIEIFKTMQVAGRYKEEAQYYRDNFSQLFIDETFFNIVNRNGISIASYPLNYSDIMQCIVLPVNTDVTVELKGGFCLAFYPRANATLEITVNGVAETVTITNTTDGGLYYPIKRYFSPYILNSGANTVKIKILSGTAYLRSISSKFVPETTNFNPSKIVAYNASSLPSSPHNLQTIFITNLNKIAVYSTVWIDSSGYQCVGTSTQKASGQANFPNGFKFYDTTLGVTQRWNGIDTWKNI